MKCVDCCYYWPDWDENNNITSEEYCHWASRAPGDIAPCEEEEEYIPNDYWGNDEMGFDPYLGCYTDDC